MPRLIVINAHVYDSINNGVYKAGFATSQKAYELAVFPLFAALDELEQRFSKQRYLVGEQITEADWRLFTTLIRFDAVYHGHFKCNLKQIEDYPACGRLYARAVPVAGRGRNGKHGAYQRALLPQSPHH